MLVAVAVSVCKVNGRVWGEPIAIAVVTIYYIRCKPCDLV